MLTTIKSGITNNPMQQTAKSVEIQQPKGKIQLIQLRLAIDGTDYVD